MVKKETVKLLRILTALKMLKNKSSAFLFLMLLLNNFLFAQGEAVEMADKMRTDGKIYVVVAVLLIIFAGIATYLFSIDRKLNKLEKQVNKDK